MCQHWLQRARWSTGCQEQRSTLHASRPHAACLKLQADLMPSPQDSTQPRQVYPPQLQHGWLLCLCSGRTWTSKDNCKAAGHHSRQFVDAGGMLGQTISYSDSSYLPEHAVPLNTAVPQTMADSPKHGTKPSGSMCLTPEAAKCPDTSISPLQIPDLPAGAPTLPCPPVMLIASIAIRQWSVSGTSPEFTSSRRQVFIRWARSGEVRSSMLSTADTSSSKSHQALVQSISLRPLQQLFHPACRWMDSTSACHEIAQSLRSPETVFPSQVADLRHPTTSATMCAPHRCHTVARSY